MVDVSPIKPNLAVITTGGVVTTIVVKYLTFGIVMPLLTSHAQLRVLVVVPAEVLSPRLERHRATGHLCPPVLGSHSV